MASCVRVVLLGGGGVFEWWKGRGRGRGGLSASVRMVAESDGS